MMTTVSSVVGKGTAATTIQLDCYNDPTGLQGRTGIAINL